MSNEERDLIQKARTGDVAAFESLIQTHQAKLFRLIMALAHNAEDAEDCLQEALLHAYRAMPLFRGESSFATWLYRVALNSTRNWLRAQSRRSREKLLERAHLPDHATSPDPGERIVHQQHLESIRVVLRALPDKYREPLLLRHYHDMPYDQIAQILGIPIGTVRSRLSEARRILGQRLRALEMTEHPTEVPSP